LKSISEQKAFLVLLLLLGCVFLFLLKPVLIPVLLASILVLLIYPVYDSISKKLKKPHLASFITTLLILLILIIPLSLVMIMVINQSIDFFSNLDISRFFSYLISSDFEQKWIVPLDSFLKSNFNLVLDIAGLSKKIAAETAKYVYSYSPAVLGQTATFIFSFLVMHVSIYFLFVEGKQVFKILMDLSPLEVKHEQRLTSELRNMVMATVYGYLVTALFQAFLASVGFWFAKVPAPMVFGSLTFFASLIPIVGATSIWLPISLVFLFKGDYVWGTFLFLYGFLLISGVDNFLKPYIMKGKAKIHILLIFFSLLGGIRLFGPIGILMGPVITALFVGCIRIYREDFLKS